MRQKTPASRNSRGGTKGTLDVTAGQAANTATTWICKTFTAAGDNGVTVYVSTVKLPANSTTYLLINTTGGANSVTGTFTKGQFDGGAFPATWDIGRANNAQEFHLGYTKP